MDYDTEQEIERLCRTSVNGGSVNVRRIDELFRKYPKEFTEISNRVRKEEQDRYRDMHKPPTG